MLYAAGIFDVIFRISLAFREWLGRREWVTKALCAMQVLRAAFSFNDHLGVKSEGHFEFPNEESRIMDLDF